MVASAGETDGDSAWTQLAQKLGVYNIRAASGTRYQRACTTRMAVFLPGKNILKTMMFRDVRTVLNERKHLKMVIRSVPDSVSLILGRTE